MTQGSSNGRIVKYGIYLPTHNEKDYVGCGVIVVPIGTTYVHMLYGWW